MSWNFECELLIAQNELKNTSHFYFEAQTGRIGKNPPINSNFYNYKLPCFMLASVIEAILKAEVSACYLSYPRVFLQDLEEFNMED